MKNKGKSIFDRQLVYSIRKFGVGTASIMIGSFLFGQHLVAAQQIDPSLDTTASPQIEGISQTSKQDPPINSSIETRDLELEASPVNESISITENESTSQLLMFARESSEETEEPIENRVEEITPVSNPSADFNKFTFTGSWTKNANEAYIDVAKTADQSGLYYEIPFLGNGIELYAHKARNHGIIRVQLDDQEPQTVDLYKAQRNAEKIFEAHNLTEGQHRLKVTSTGENNAANTTQRYVNQVQKARIFHQPYQPTAINFNQENLAIKVGQTSTTSLTVSPNYAESSLIQYRVDDPTLASVDNKGRVTGLKSGTTQLLAQFRDISARIPITIEDAVANYSGTFVDNNRHYYGDDYQTLLNGQLTETSLTAWKNDSVTTQIAILPLDSGLKNLRYELTDLTSSKGSKIDKQFISAHFIQELLGYQGNAGYHRADKLTIPTSPLISRPDLLLNSPTIDVAYNRIQNLWVNVDVPKDAEAGDYSTTITLRADGIEQPLIFNLRLTVKDAVLENLKKFDIELWQYPYRSAEYYQVTPFSEEHLSILRPMMEKYKAIGGNGITASIVEEAWGGQTYADGDVRVPSMIKWFKESDGQFSFDFTDFDKWVSFADSLGLAEKIVGYSMIPWGNKVSYFNKATNQQESITVAVTDPQYADVWKPFLRALVHHLDEKDWFDRFYMGIDERPNMQLAFNLIDSVPNETGKTLKIAAAANHFSGSFASVAERVDHLSIGTPHMKGDMVTFERMVADRESKGKKTTLYTATEEYPNSMLFNLPGESYFSVLYGAKFNTNGFLRWAFDAWVKEPLTNLSHWAFEAGDTQLVYPDKKDAIQPKPQSSVRLEKMAEAVRDVNKLYQMKAEFPELEREIESLLDSLEDRYDQTTPNNRIGERIAREPSTTTKTRIPQDLATFKQKLNKISDRYLLLKSGQTLPQLDVDQAARHSYYSFDGNSQDNWANRHGQGSQLQFVEGKSGTALQITENSRLTFPAGTDLGKNWTVSYWLLDQSPANSDALVLKTSAGQGFTSELTGSNGKLGVRTGTRTGDKLTMRSSTTLKNQWRHYTWTHSTEAGLKLYIDGQFVESNSWTKTNQFPAPIQEIGGSQFRGAIDELKIFNRELSTEEISMAMAVPGIETRDKSIQLYVNHSHKIKAYLMSQQEGAKLVYTSLDPALASVDQTGRITALKRGQATIRITATNTNYQVDIPVTITKEILHKPTIPQYDLPENFKKDLEKSPNTNRQYLGQPDMLILKDDKTLITSYPIGHGHGPLVMQVSKDNGLTWTEKTDIPEDWAHSLETPTLYRLDMTDGSEKLILITAMPNWANNQTGGWKTSLSTDGGQTWSDYQGFHPNRNGQPHFTIVAMSSLIQLRDENGNNKDEWMGIFHDNSFTNYKTILSFDENGQQVWSSPEPLLAPYREIERTAQMCEIGMFRVPNSNRIIGLVRSQSHQHSSLLIYSDDEGQTWSRPEALQGALQGERHKILVDPISNKLLVTFREIILDYNQNGAIENGDWMAGDWMAWVGSVEDLLEQNEGEYRIRLAEDFTKSAKSGDTGYTGMTVSKDGTFNLVSYGHFDQAFSTSWTGKVTEDLSYIKHARFTLADLEKALGIRSSVDEQEKPVTSEAAELTEETETSEATENSNQTEISETTENSNQTETSQTAENSKQTEISQTTDNSNQTETSQTAENSKQTEISETTENSEPSSSNESPEAEGQTEKLEDHAPVETTDESPITGKGESLTHSIPPFDGGIVPNLAPTTESLPEGQLPLISQHGKGSSHHIPAFTGTIVLPANENPLEEKESPVPLTALGQLKTSLEERQTKKVETSLPNTGDQAFSPTLFSYLPLLGLVGLMTKSRKREVD
ncbi:TPA: glycoside hydrolase domain-containing protein [Streptococcus suis]